MDRFVFNITTAFLLIFCCVACSSSVHTDPVKVDDYLYEISYSDYDFDELSSVADRIFRKKGKTPSAACSAVRKDTLFGRNFDWAYDKMPEFIIRTEASPERFASIGIASPIGVFEEDQINKSWGKLMLKALPIFTVDGINEKGVACCVNVVPPGDCGYTLNTNPEGKRLCAPLIVRLVLDKAGSAKEAIEMVRDRNIYTTLLDKLESEYHFMIADSVDNYVVEFVDNRMVVLEGEKIMTNFHLARPDTPHGMGHERYDKIRAGYDSVCGIEDMTNLMKSVWYSGAYDESQNPLWLTDLCNPMEHKDFTIQEIPENPEKFIEVFKKKVEKFKNRSRDAETLEETVCHSVHTSIYDIKNKVLIISTQESGRGHTLPL